MLIERLSIELTNHCNKTCDFCYNHSGPDGDTLWNVDEVVSLVLDCVRHGVKAVSFGGGEPLLYPELSEVLEILHGEVFRSITTNGLMLTDSGQFTRLVAARPEKVHVSIHEPAAMTEVRRVIATVQELESAGIASGVNLLVSADQVEAASHTARMLWDAGIDNQRIVYIPQRGTDMPTAKAVATVAGGPFQSMSCLTSCGSSPRFCSISWDRAAAWCSYTSARQRLPSLSYSGLVAALAGLGVVNCAATMRVE
jgi:molybdenum cofactor biosynthesis enzyme MoaA